MPTSRKRPRRYLRINDLCERYHVSRMTIHRWCQNGTLPKPSTHFGDSPLWDETLLDRHDDAQAAE
jgi:predicted DNA-binding transcriptional regulator AlpA